MSKATAVGTVIGGLGGLVAGAVAALEFFSPGEINSPTDLIGALQGIEIAVREKGLSIDELTVEQQAQVAQYFQPLASQFARNLSKLNQEEATSIGNIIDLAQGQTGEFRLSDGAIVDVSFERWGLQTGSRAEISYEGDQQWVDAGWRVEPVGTNCVVLFVGPVGENREHARFRARC